MADEEEILKLFDSYWFEHQIFKTKPPATNPLLQFDEQQEEPNLSRLPTLHVRSLSDQFLRSKEKLGSDSESPNSVLLTLKLQTILSGKEVGEFFEAKPENFELVGKKKLSSGGRRRASSKSLSELEFEEVKGFMDLGFVFSEEDKDSRLVSIIPGLQRLGKSKVENGGGDEEEEEKEKEKGIDESSASRPYLSEAWDVLDERKAAVMQMNWRIPDFSFGNEVDIKDHLRLWAHFVASTVK